jgi:hypothetical protein
VVGVLSARIAELLCLHPVGMLLLVFCGCVISMFAVIALQGNDFAHSPTFLE